MNKISDDQLLEELKNRMRQKEEALRKLRETTKELKKVNEKLAYSEAMKSNFISNITNEIVNPFTSILGLSKSILKLSKSDWERLQSMVKMIYSEAFNLDFQLKNIFMAAEIEAGEVHVNNLKIDINDIIETVIDSFEENATKKEITITYHSQIDANTREGFNFISDPQKLQLILTNLLDNAIKFSSAANEVVIRAALIENRNLQISVQDYGAGISEENKVIIYDRFRKGDPGISTPNRGHGLGLSIIKALVDLFNGSIHLRTQLHQGSTFTIVLPEGEEDKDEFSTMGNDVFFNENEETDETF